MNPEIGERWVAALLSKKYPQGRDVLRTQKSEYCCLGVLCDLAVEDGLARWEQVPGSDENGWWKIVSLQNSDEQAINYLPEFIREWAGLEYSNPPIDHQVRGTLAGLNDASASFQEIAGIIKEQLL